MIQAKRWLVALMSPTLVCVALQGCGSNDPTKSPDAPPPPATEADFPIMKNSPKGEPPKGK